MSTAVPEHILDEFDLGEVAKFLSSVVPEISLCEFVEMPFCSNPSSENNLLPVHSIEISHLSVLCYRGKSSD